MNKINQETANKIVDLMGKYFNASYEFGASPCNATYGTRLAKKNIMLMEFNRFEENENLETTLKVIEETANAEMLSGETLRIEGITARRFADNMRIEAYTSACSLMGYPMFK